MVRSVDRRAVPRARATRPGVSGSVVLDRTDVGGRRIPQVLDTVVSQAASAAGFVGTSLGSIRLPKVLSGRSLHEPDRAQEDRCACRRAGASTESRHQSSPAEGQGRSLASLTAHASWLPERVARTFATVLRLARSLRAARATFPPSALR